MTDDLIAVGYIERLGYLGQAGLKQKKRKLMLTLFCSN
jgi:hypothetical protein